MVAEKLPFALGVNSTCTVHSPFGAIVTATQEFGTKKEAAWEPELVIAVTMRLPSPVLLTVKGTVLLVPSVVEGKPSTAGETLATGACTPVPLITMVCGEFGALSLIVRDAVRLAAVTGVNFTRIVQAAWGASETPMQVVVCVKSLGLLPLVEIDVTFSVVVPVLVSVMGSVMLDFRYVGGKLRVVEDRPTAGRLIPEPLKLTDCGLFAALSAMSSEAVAVPVFAGVNITWVVQEPPPAIGTPMQLAP